MAGGTSIPDSAFTGWRHWFNTSTVRGRSTIVLTTYASVLLTIMAVRRRSNKKAALAAATAGKAH